MSTREKLEKIKEINEAKESEYKANWFPFIFFISFAIVMAYFIATIV